MAKEVKLVGSRRWLAVVAGAVSMTAAACDGSSEVVAPALEAPAAAAVVQGPEQRFAAALALALRDAGLRDAVHQAMAASPLNEHKLVLQEFLVTPAGGRLVTAMAAARGVEEGAVRGWAAAMPEMDFYVPFVEHRRAWTGGGDLVVAANLDVDQTSFTGYTPAGGSLSFDSRNGTPGQTVIFMHPAEPKGRRADADAAAGPRRTIESASQPASNVFVIPEEGGPSRVVTYVGYVSGFINWKGDGVGGIELMVKHYDRQGGTRLDEEIMSENDHWTWAGYEYDYVTEPHRAINFNAEGNTWIKVWERDSGVSEPTGDEFWGEGQFGGFNVRHRFYTYRLVEYVYDTSACRNPYDCGETPSVDIWYSQY